MMNNKFYYPFFVLLFLYSCKNDDRNNKSFFEYLNKIDQSKKIAKVYMIIPSTGCSGCINDAEIFLKNNLEKPSLKKIEIKYIVTNIQSIKILRAKLNKFIDLSSPNLFIDKDNYFTKDSLFKSIYPKIYIIDKGKLKIDEILEVSPNEEGLKILQKKITNS